jgi:peptidoglycan/xylan/chitin deacetylase (PgdA/CDA1 family)
MDRSQQRHSSPSSDDFVMPSALSRAPHFGDSAYARMSGKLSRFLARNVATKKLTMRNSRPIISFTFDDVPVTACEAGVRILEQHGVRGTFYVAGAGCGAASPVGLLASIEQLRAVWAKGHEIGCQTYSHAAVSLISRAKLEQELSRNRSVLKSIDGSLAVENFAYPYGDLSFRARRYLETRFDSCRSVDRGINTAAADLGALKSWPLENASIDHAKIADLIAATVAANGWLVFFSHDVTAQPSRFGVSPDLLEWAVGRAVQSGCALVTVAEALKLAGGHEPLTNEEAAPAERHDGLAARHYNGFHTSLAKPDYES